MSPPDTMIKKEFIFRTRVGSGVRIEPDATRS